MADVQQNLVAVVFQAVEELTAYQTDQWALGQLEVEELRSRAEADQRQSVVVRDLAVVALYVAAVAAKCRAAAVTPPAEATQSPAVERSSVEATEQTTARR